MSSSCIPRGPFLVLAEAAKRKGVFCRTMKEWIGKQVLGIKQSRVWFVFLDRNFRKAKKYKRVPAREKESMERCQRFIEANLDTVASRPFFFGEKKKKVSESREEAVLSQESSLTREEKAEEEISSEERRKSFAEEVREIHERVKKMGESFRKRREERAKAWEKIEGLENWFHRLLDQLLGSKEPYEFFDFWYNLFFQGTPSDDAVPYFIYKSLSEEKKKWEQKYLELLGRSKKKECSRGSTFFPFSKGLCHRR